ncbi:MAG: SDR family NAD(P)-dependent oxidoreductase [Acidimicrobiales bacterium]
MDKAVLITGASSGIGRAAADLLARSGWSVAGASRRGTGGDRWDGLVMNVDDDRSVANGVAAVVARHSGHLDAVVANAGWGLAGAVEQTTVTEAKYQFETNFFGVHRLVQAALPVMRAQQSGRIVVVGSIAGLIAIPYQAFYTATKFALEGYVEALAWEVSRFGIAASIVEPGNIRTEFTASRRDVRPPGGSLPDPYGDAVAKAVALMERDEASGTTAAAAAAAIERVLNARRPRRRVTVGRWDERAGAIAKRLLPYRIFEGAARRALGA